MSRSKFERRTYVSTTVPQPQVTLFYESTDGKQSAQSSTETYKLASSKSPVVYLGTIAAAQGAETSTEILDLLVVKQDGEIECLDGNTLHKKWTSPATAIGRDIGAPLKNVRIEFAQLTNAYATSQNIFKGRKDLLAMFSDDSEESRGSQGISEEGFNPEVLILITKSGDSNPVRNVHMVTLPRKGSANFDSSSRSVKPLLTTILPTPKGSQFTNGATFSLQVASGTILQLDNDAVTTFEFSESVLTEVSKIRMERATSFQRLSSTAVMVSNDSTISVFNPKYQSRMDSVNFESSKSRGACKLVSYFPKDNTAVAISDNELVAIQIESKSRAAGLLIDSIGCSTEDQVRPIETIPEAFAAEVPVETMGLFLPGSINLAEAGLKSQAAPMEIAYNAGNVGEFDKLMAKKLMEEPELNPVDVDKRWAIYALSKIFSWTKSDDLEYRLATQFYPPDTFMWLLKHGFMTAANIESALRVDIKSSALDSLPSGELVNTIVEVDPSIDFLRILISRTYLDASELAHAIRILMDSLELFGDNAHTKQALLTNGEDLDMDDVETEKEVLNLQAEAEADIALIEYQLGAGSGVKGETLSLALGKLYTCPTELIVHALQTVFTSQEIVSLIYQLRFDLRGGAWTSRYLDQTDDLDEEDEMSNSSIIIICSLLHNCIDAIGAGGWISGSVKLVNGDAFEAEELIGSLKNEVSATLEGLEEAAYLKGVLGELVRYGASVEKVLPKPQPQTQTPESPAGIKRKTMHKPVLMQLSDEARILPFGLKADQNISMVRIGAGGELYKRSMRDVGRLKSRKVPKYSQERIEI